MKIFIISLLALCLGCGQSFLDLPPQDQSSVANFFRNGEDLNTAVNAAYGALKTTGQYNKALHAVGELRSDNTEILDAQSGVDLVQLDLFTTQSNNPLVNAMWNDHYNGIQQCNMVIDRAPGITMDESLKQRLVAEVRFLRALMYFNLVRSFGDVPLVIKEVKDFQEGYEYGRESVDRIYEQIVADLQVAEVDLLNRYTGADVGRATIGAAKSLLGKVYLTRSQYSLAVSKLREVINAEVYGLMDNYADIYSISNKNHKESIFEIQYKKGGIGQGSPFHNQFAPRNSGLVVSIVGQAHGYNIPTQDMEDAYEEGDVRQDISMASGYMDGQQFVGLKYITKYKDTPFQPDDADNNWPVLRYADVILMLAECLNEEGFVADGEAFDLLNSIRNRAGVELVSSDHPDVNYRVADQTQFRAAIAQERRVELAFENHRWFDLVRTGKALEVMNAKGFSITENQLVLPIPLSQVQINEEKMKQNDGYQ